MSWSTATDPQCTSCDTPAIEVIIEARTHDIGGFTVGRILPSIRRRMVGPFIFFDHMGPGDFAPGQGIDVRPHPHINLATVTYLFEGEIHHRDSLGIHQPIQPGALNWMTAGRGIVHSERSGAEFRKSGGRVHGIQLWIALPKASEEVEPAFHHHPADTIPTVPLNGGQLRVLVGTAYGHTSPVTPFSPSFYVEATLAAGSQISLPEDYEDRAAYIVEGKVRCAEETADARRMLVFSPKTPVTLHAETETRLMLLGGDRLEGERFMFWNFVSSSQERIEQAKRDWKDDKEDKFPKVPGDEQERIPLPEN